ncbi:glycosyltransferase family 4 protein [candidate division KSB1 bacterium]|nr:glycosyltransferase family 4 protein [candidate division KSB1 bacterium]
MARSKYNILHVIDKFSMDGVNPSSCAYLIRDWFRYSDRYMFQVMACGIKKAEPAAKIYEQEGMSCFFLGNGKYSLRNVSNLVRLINEKGINIVHLHGYSSANFGRIAARRVNIPNIVHEHAVLRILPHQYMADYFLRNMTDSGVAVSQAVKDFMNKGRHIPEDKIHIIWNGINLDNFKKSGPQAVSHLKKEFNISDDKYLLGTITRFREEKGNEFLIRAMPRVVKRHPGILLLLAGEGPLREKLTALVNTLGLQDHIRFVGFREDIVDFLSMVNLVAIPSRIEGFGLVMAEAMSVGTTVVSTDVGGLREIAKHGQDAWLVPADDPDALANGIIELVEKPELALKLRENALKSRQRFGIQSNVAQLEDLYKKLLKI